MAIIATLTQSNTAQPGRPTNFVLGVQNTGGSAVNVTGLQAMVTDSAGRSGFPCNIGPFIAPIGTSVASTTGVQFNMQIAGSGTVYFPFSVQFFSQGIRGSGSQPSNQFQLNVTGLLSDGTVFGPPPLNGVVNTGNQGSPPNPAFVVGQLNFSFAANSGLAL